ncbi:class II SORL domain-containing protein [Marinisporobacter balticus]|uniref:Superoxide reductase n=1 Tax=Marinisporobacter balticus TaxID=2018667 RepID=A0A4R2K9V0_9FIRM|nr:class II SORL domain-containing protein [Marinisporobacter balticus]TCO70193.1 superoxide reductase [Marinisporobacter balticus]
MDGLKQMIQSGDWKGEKHVPVIHAPEKITSDTLTEIKISIGDAIKHPNTLEHHIAWFKLFYLPATGKFPIELGTYEFRAHGEGNAFTEPCVSTNVKLQTSGILYALSYCNLHGLWESSKEIVIE